MVKASVSLVAHAESIKTKKMRTCDVKPDSQDSRIGGQQAWPVWTCQNWCPTCMSVCPETLPLKPLKVGNLSVLASTAFPAILDQGCFSILRTLTILFKGVLASLYVQGLQLRPKRKNHRWTRGNRGTRDDSWKYIFWLNCLTTICFNILSSVSMIMKYCQNLLGGISGSKGPCYLKQFDVFDNWWFW